jgi:hypothetical protein
MMRQADKPWSVKRSMTHSLRVVCASVALVACPAAPKAVLYAQEHDQCTFLCAPELKIEPTFTIENLFNPARVETIEDGVAVQTMRQGRDRVFELVVVADVPTEIPRVGFAFEAIFSPFRDETEVELELELNLAWLESEQTGGWVESHFDIIDKFSPAERPTDMSAYTHKLNFELDTAVFLFNALPEDNWLRNVELERSLDYVATGLPRAGNVIGKERFLDDASPWSFSLVFVFPLAPLSP